LILLARSERSITGKELDQFMPFRHDSQVWDHPTTNPVHQHSCHGTLFALTDIKSERLRSSTKVSGPHPGAPFAHWQDFAPSWPPHWWAISAELVPSDRASRGSSAARWRYRAASAAGRTLPQCIIEISAEWTPSIQGEQRNLYFKSTFVQPPETLK